MRQDRARQGWAAIIFLIILLIALVAPGRRRSDEKGVPRIASGQSHFCRSTEPLLSSAGIPNALRRAEAILDATPEKGAGGGSPPWILLTNPSVATDDHLVLKNKGSTMIVAYRASYNGSTPKSVEEPWPPQGNFFTVLRAFREPLSKNVPLKTYRRHLNELKAGRFVILDAAPPASLGSICPLSPYHGFLDSRPVVLGDGRLVIVAKSPNPKDCTSQRIVVIHVDLDEFLRLSLGRTSRIATPRLIPKSVTYLHVPNMRHKERNWVPFTTVDDGRLLLSYTLEPHVVLSCDWETPSGNASCNEVARTSFPGFVAYMGVPATELHGGSQGVRWDETTNIVIGHFYNGTHPGLYHFFFYVFDSRPPYALRRAGTPFAIMPIAPRIMQFVAGLSRTEDWFTITYGKMDEEAWASALHRCDVERLLAGGVKTRGDDRL